MKTNLKPCCAKVNKFSCFLGLFFQIQWSTRNIPCLDCSLSFTVKISDTKCECNEDFTAVSPINVT